MTDLRKRIKKLESEASQEPNKERVSPFVNLRLMLAVGYYIGNYAPRLDSPAAACARALRYENTSEFLNILQGHENESAILDFNERGRLANQQVLYKFGVSWDDEPDAIAAAVERMEAGYSEEYKRRVLLLGSS
jgi:hypothetical protein